MKRRVKDEQTIGEIIIRLSSRFLACPLSNTKNTRTRTFNFLQDIDINVTATDL